MTTKTPSAGARLRADLDEALRHASAEAGRELEFDEAERHVIDQAVAAADRGRGDVGALGERVNADTGQVLGQ